MKNLTTELFIDKVKKVHNDIYDYKLVEYKNSHTKVKILCHNHGYFEQTPNSHLNKNGCPSCSNNKKLTTEDFIKKAEKIHNYEYDYSFVVYKN